MADPADEAGEAGTSLQDMSLSTYDFYLECCTLEAQSVHSTCKNNVHVEDGTMDVKFEWTYSVTSFRL